MTITYASYLNGDVGIRHGEHNGKKLVLGWLINNLHDATAAEALEKWYAIHADGRIKETEWRPLHEVWFNKPGTKWTDTDHVSIYAEFIGQYVDDMFG